MRITTNDHDDCIQTSWRVTNLTIRNNYCEQNNNKSNGNAQGFWLTGSNGTLMVTNNIIYLPNSGNTLIGAMPTTDGTNPYGNSFAAYILNNTLVGGKWGNISIENSPNAVIKNNIIRNLKSNSVALRIQAADPAAAKVDYNLFYAPDGNPIIYYHESQYLTLTQWKAKGYDVHSKMADPQLVNIAGRDFSLKGTSPAINAGIADPNAPAIDYIGTLRPQGRAFDIGAYEYK